MEKAEREERDPPLLDDVHLACYASTFHPTRNQREETICAWLELADFA
jgi:hypothetical protein